MIVIITEIELLKKSNDCHQVDFEQPELHTQSSGLPGCQLLVGQTDLTPTFFKNTFDTFLRTSLTPFIEYLSHLL